MEKITPRLYSMGGGVQCENRKKKHLSTKAHNTDTRLCNRGGNPAQTAAIRTIANPAALVTDPLVRLADQSDGGVGSGVQGMCLYV